MKGSRIKRLIYWLLSVTLAAAAYVPCRKYAVWERGSTTYGGELLIPILIIIIAVWIYDYIKELREREEKQ